MLETMDKNLQIYFDDFIRLTYNSFLSKDIHTILADDEKEAVKKLEDQWMFKNFAINLVGDRNDIEGVYLIGKNGNSYSYSSYGNIMSGYDITTERWFQKIKKVMVNL